MSSVFRQSYFVGCALVFVLTANLFIISSFLDAKMHASKIEKDLEDMSKRLLRSEKVASILNGQLTQAMSNSDDLNAKRRISLSSASLADTGRSASVGGGGDDDAAAAAFNATAAAAARRATAITTLFGDNRASWSPLTHAALLQATLQNEIESSQRPADCRTVRKLFCQSNAAPSCGVACELHWYAMCLAAALMDDRVLIVNVHKWRYLSLPSKSGLSDALAAAASNAASENRSEWEQYFQPLSSCNYNQDEEEQAMDFLFSRTGGESGKGGHKFVKAEYKDVAQLVANVEHRGGSSATEALLPFAMPRTIFKQVAAYHDDARAWWASQFVAYVVRPSASSAVAIEKARQKFDFDWKGLPTVGIHIRRSGKLPQNAHYHSVSEYMDRVAVYYALHYPSLRDERRRVFIATDDVDALDELERDYATQFTLLYDKEVALKASLPPRRRANINQLHNAMIDLHLLSECAFLVGTFSSHFFRFAYELQQVRAVNGGAQGISLSNDVQYTYDPAIDRAADYFVVEAYATKYVGKSLRMHNASRDDAIDQAMALGSLRVDSAANFKRNDLVSRREARASAAQSDNSNKESAEL